jgi:hypothetical protein
MRFSKRIDSGFYHTLSTKLEVVLTTFFRLIQNRKSAQKCRLKKKAEFQKMKEDVKKMHQ